ncbi:MAG TPA: endonuclease III [Pirellulaceae bacterium]|jgi:endonuclease-3|nr:endonuclease III [Pirellulaceae bacterium]
MAKLTKVQTHAREVNDALEKEYPEATCALVHKNGFELLAATILSAQCTDERVNLTTPALFKRYPGPTELAKADQDELETLIKSTGFFRAKAKSLVGMAKGVVEEYDGDIPQNLDDLVKLPGVGRKTANVVLGTCYGIPSGVVVDTHVGRNSVRLGLTKETDPVKVERDLMALLPEEEWIDFSHRMILHGRAICKARRPECERCPLSPLCPKIGVNLPPSVKAPKAADSAATPKKAAKKVAAAKLAKKKASRK